MLHHASNVATKFHLEQNLYCTEYKSICEKRSILTIKTYVRLSVEISHADSLRHCFLFFVNDANFRQKRQINK